MASIFIMFEFMRKNQYKISRLVLLLFVLSTFGIAAQASAHTLMMTEMQQHKAQMHSMGIDISKHDMSGHCQPVICESVIALDDQSKQGSQPVSLIDITLLPAGAVASISPVKESFVANREHNLKQDYGPPPLDLTGILRI